MKMKTGHFGLLDQAETIAKAEYDDVELHIWEIMSLDDGEYNAAKQKLRDINIDCEVFDNPLPLDKVVADEDFDMEYYKEYLKKAVARTAEMGARYFVFGNGKTRSVPEAKAEEAKKKNDDLMVFLCDEALKANITIMMEPLHQSISNRVLSIPEAYDYAQSLGCRNLKTLLDFRWFIAGGHPYDDIVRYADFVKHVHVDNPLYAFPERHVPMEKDGFDYKPLFDTLKSIGYKGIISFEANTFSDFETDIKKGLELLRANNITPYYEGRREAV